MIPPDFARRLERERNRLVIENTKLREAMQFYASEETWEDYGGEALGDYGDRARNVLANSQAHPPQVG